MARKLEVEIVGDASSLHKALSKADGSANSFGNTIGKLGKVSALAAGAAGIGAITFALKTGIGEWEQHQQVAAQTNAVLKSTGGVAGITASHVEELANSILKKTGIDDEAVQSSENLLLAFTNVRNEAGKGNDVFDRAVQVIQDYSVRTGKSATSATIAFGKALNDPVKGLGALGRAGVILTDKQKDLIKSWVKHGDTLKAQNYLLEQLENRFGGAAEAAGKTLPGQINIARETFNNWMGDLVAKTIPIIQETIGWLRDHWPEISAAITKFWNDVQPGLQAFLDIIGSIVGYISENWGTIEPIVSGVGTAVGAGLQLMLTPLQLISDILHGDWGKLWSDFAAAPQTFLKGIKGLFTPIGALIKKALVAGITGIAGEAWDVINNIGSFLADKADAIAGWGAKMAGQMIGAYLGLWVGIGSKAWDVINNIGSFLAGKADDIAGWGLAIGRGIVGGIKDGIVGVGKAVGGYAEGIAKTIAGAVVRLINTVIDRINSALEFDIPLPFGKSFTVNPPDIPHISLPQLASGGMLAAGQAAIVGERGPELFVPSTGGAVIPNGVGSPMVVNLVLDGKVAAQALIDPLRGEARIYKQQTGKQAFA